MFGLGSVRQMRRASLRAACQLASSASPHRITADTASARLPAMRTLPRIFGLRRSIRQSLAFATIILCATLHGTPAAASQEIVPSQREPRAIELPAVLAGYSDQVQETAGIGRGCVVLESSDLRFVLGSIEIDVPFAAYRASVRAAIEPVKQEIVEIDASREGTRTLALDSIYAKNLARIRAAVDVAQVELMRALGVDATGRQRMIRHALWRATRAGEDGIGFDIGMLFEDESEATSVHLRAALAVHTEAAAHARALLAAHDARVGPVRETSIAIHRSAFNSKRTRNAAQTDRLATSLVGVREANDALFLGISETARGYGALEEALEWRARAFKLRGARLLPRLDLLDTFDAARIDGDAIDPRTMRDIRQHALEQRDAAMSDLVVAFAACKQSLTRHGPHGEDAERVVQNFADSAAKWEACERRIGVALKAQLGEGTCRAATAIDGYLNRQDAIASEHWRDLLQFWTSFVEDQRREPVQ